MHIYFAPLEGITTYPYRNLHHKYFGGVEKYFTPFLAPGPEQGMSEGDAGCIAGKQCRGTGRSADPDKQGRGFSSCIEETFGDGIPGDQSESRVSVRNGHGKEERVGISSLPG